MEDSEKIPRLSRMTAILLKLQTKPIVTVKELAAYFEVSKRTIYRDIAALEQSGVAIVSADGKGFGLMEGYKVPPVMFTEAEANAIVLAEKIIEKTTDNSLIREFSRAVDKIRAVLKTDEKTKSHFLSERIIIGKNWSESITSSYLTEIQRALTHQQVLQISYKKENATEPELREVEPFAIYHNPNENWVLIAWCRLRDDFRNFRLDRMESVVVLDDHFKPHSLSLDEYIEIQRVKYFSKTVT